MRVWVPVCVWVFVCVKQSGGCIRVSKMRAERYHRSPLAAAVRSLCLPVGNTLKEVEQRTWLRTYSVHYRRRQEQTDARPTDQLTEQAGWQMAEAGGRSNEQQQKQQAVCRQIEAQRSARTSPVQVQAPETKTLGPTTHCRLLTWILQQQSIDQQKMGLVCRCTGAVRWLHLGRTRPGPEIMCVCARAWPLCVVAPCTGYSKEGGASTLTPSARRGYSKSTRIRAAELFFLGFSRGPFVEPCVAPHPSIDLLASAVRFILRRSLYCRPCTSSS